MVPVGAVVVFPSWGTAGRDCSFSYHVSANLVLSFASCRGMILHECLSPRLGRMFCCFNVSNPRLWSTRLYFWDLVDAKYWTFLRVWAELSPFPS